MEVADSRTMERVRAGIGLDQSGIPYGGLPEAFVESQPEAVLVFPNSKEVYREVLRGSGSVLAQIVAFDDKPRAGLIASYMVSASAGDVFAWYGDQLSAHRWEPLPAPSSSVDVRRRAYQSFRRGDREWFSITVPTADQIARRLEHLGLKQWLRPDETYYSIDYRIYVELPPRPT